VSGRDQYLDSFMFRHTGYRPDDSRWVDPTRTRERSAYPYSYDEFFIWGDRKSKEGASGDYSDRLWQWDREKASRCWKDHVGGTWQGATKAKLSAFLTAYHGKPIKAVALAEGCNPSNGYPYWIVWWTATPPQPSAAESETQ